VPAVPTYLIEPIWEQFATLQPPRKADHPLGAISEFEENKARLYRRDGSKVYGEAEHSERLGKLTAELSEKVEAVITEAQEDAQGYEQEALALSYTDPTKGLIGTDRERFSVSLPLVREDCEGLSADALLKRLAAVSAGSDRVAKVLHARYGKSRAEAMERKLEKAARSGGASPPLMPRRSGA
jgi:hypothetical protein